MPEEERFRKVVVSGHYHSIDLIRVSDEGVRMIRGNGLSIHHPYPREWIQSRSEKIFQGFFENVMFHIGRRSTRRRCPKNEKDVETLNGTFIGHFETSRTKLTLPICEDFDAKKLRVRWTCVELNRDSEIYNLASVYYDDCVQDDFDHERVHEAFYLIDATEGIIQLEVIEHDAAFTLTEIKV